MGRLLTGFCLTLIALPVCAGQVRVDISKKDCLRLLNNSAEYVAGISVTGQPVVPADLNSDISLPDLNDLTFPVYLDMKRDFPFRDSEIKAGVIPLAQVEIKNGQFFVNDTLLSENSAASLKKECKALLKEQNIDKNNLTNVQQMLF